MADWRHDLPLHRADAAEEIASESARRVIARGFACVAGITVGEKPIVDAVARGGRWRENEVAAIGAERSRLAVAVDQNVGSARRWR
jgi:hypothetical protein